MWNAHKQKAVKHMPILHWIAVALKHYHGVADSAAQGLKPHWAVGHAHISISALHAKVLFEATCARCSAHRHGGE